MNHEINSEMYKGFIAKAELASCVSSHAGSKRIEIHVNAKTLNSYYLITIDGVKKLRTKNFAKAIAAYNNAKAG